MTSFFHSNQEYLEESFPNLLNLIKSTQAFQQRLDAYTNSSNRLKDCLKEDTALSNLITTSIRSQQDKGIQRILLPRVQSNFNSIQSDRGTDILKKTIDATKSYLLDSLPNLTHDSYQPDSQKDNLAKDVILMGSLGLLELDSLIISCQINNLLVVDDNYESLSKLIQLADFKSIIEKCKKCNISLHFIIEKDFESLVNLLKKQLACEMFSSCFGFYLVVSPPPSALLESIAQWLKSQEGFAEYLMGLFGQETDEVNQSIHSIYIPLLLQP